ncbi:MAG: hypothetical protein MZW92_01335 [Comamonadaceae bacterium]|nr:hypothetical protein [Comamonadaceae bacterium]
MEPATASDVLVLGLGDTRPVVRALAGARAARSVRVADTRAGAAAAPARLRAARCPACALDHRRRSTPTPAATASTLVALSPGVPLRRAGRRARPSRAASRSSATSSCSRAALRDSAGASTQGDRHHRHQRQDAPSPRWPARMCRAAGLRHRAWPATSACRCSTR